ncbi:MAG: ATP-dependent zinc metalloprotease FtsH [Deltaproteobacteria bacterium]|nr:ATP-dependent zinc metalloprotease FtsH [Deltaproteobacteria bacterium]
MNRFSKNLALLLLIFLIFAVLFQLVTTEYKGPKRLTFTQFNEIAKEGRLLKVDIKGRQFSGVFRDPDTNETVPFESSGFESRELYDELFKAGVEVSVTPDVPSPLWNFLITWLPMILIIGIFIFFMRQLQGSGGKAMSFGKSRARLVTGKQNKVTFKDVAGIDESKDELAEIIEFLRDPKRFTKIGGRIPKGVLLVGAPGTGKTLLAKAIAGEAGVPFFSISGSDFVEMFVGVGASRVRDLFVQGKKNAPCIIFIDEIDAVGRHRGAGLGGGHDEREQTLNQLLVEMDGFESNEGVILIAATNRPDVLDPALLRPGRFDRQVVVPPPDINGREGILKVHTRKIPLAKDVTMQVIARGTPGFTGADLANLVNEAALIAAREGKNKVAMRHFEAAKDKVLMGIERRSMVMSEDEKKNTAYHEAGHALVGAMLKNVDPVHKVTIIPRGVALGVTQTLPVDDRHTYSRHYLIDLLAFMMGGRVAEEIALGHVTTGAANDIQRATDMARRMVTEWGMSDSLGPLRYGRQEEMVFLGKELAHHKDYSEATANEIDREIRTLVTDALGRAREILTDQRDALERIAGALLEYETIDGNELRGLIEGKPIVRQRVEDEEPEEGEAAESGDAPAAEDGDAKDYRPIWERGDDDGAKHIDDSGDRASAKSAESEKDQN